ncbi:restriction endonuclease subunit S [Coprococcus eutactus]|jgi:type I restriction enzyme S subunit|uniref:restriction endonuclease subunit S n=1 Tax=Coprococcus eutactus TaxID=33043 RepID=UPI00156DED9C|nr:restriction endonuclease subunit S [Coprococcus eutactus]MCB5503108.1 restriction endonuclease subunit S [Coprococcus eutactus]NSC94934.1 restriction endonuclease subunit S [Coprococcus eutactus]NSD34006.1 restriction endonuclease subunit S [Coprococcus eutactus]
MVLEDVCELIADCPHTTAPDEGKGYPLIRTPNVGKGRLLLEGVHRVSKDIYDKRNMRAIPQKDDIIFAREAPAGNAALIREGQEVCLGQRTVLIRPDCEKVFPEYLVYYLLAPEQQYKLLGTANGATVAHVNLPVIRKMPIELPDIDVQQKIAGYISIYDDLIENNQRQIKLLEEAAQRLYKEWFVDLRFPGYEDCKIVDGVPVEWGKNKLDEIADVIMGQSPKSEFYNKEHKGLPFHQGVGSYGARFVQDDTYSTSFTKVAEANSILFSVRAPVGRLNITKNKIVIGRGIAAINSKSGFQSYLFYALKERFFKDDILGNGAIFASISKNELLNQVFVIPDEKIMSAYEKIAAALDKKIEVVDMQLQQLVEARDRLLPKLMNGEIEV